MKTGLNCNIWYLFVVAFLHSVLAIGQGESVELFDSLNRIIRYFDNNAEARTADGMLGIYLCKEQILEMVQGTPNVKANVLRKTLKKLDELCLVYERESGDSSDFYNNIVTKNLLHPNLWHREEQIPFLYSYKMSAIENAINRDNFFDKIDEGSPTATESDECLAELLNPPLCIISWKCLQVMSPNIDSHGYHLTHKLLYYMIMMNRNCAQSLQPHISAQANINFLCALILKERTVISQLGNPPILRDLALEQTLLCGLNGFANFLEQNWIGEILSWQNKTTGCYEYFGNDERQKRSAVMLKEHCSDHMSGLAAAALGLFAKFVQFA